MESTTRLKLGNLDLLQADKGYRFSLDPVLLVRFTRVEQADRVVDLGTGAGVIPLLMARLYEVGSAAGIEVQLPLAERAQKNVILNRLQDTVAILQGDLRQIRELLPGGQTDLVVTNPPYRKANSGRLAPDPERAGARHELTGGWADFVRAANWLLKNGGRFSLIHLAERLPEIMTELVAQGFQPRRLRTVHPRQGQAARLVLVEARKGGGAGMQIESPLVIYQGEGRDYTPEVLNMYQDDQA